MPKFINVILAIVFIATNVAPVHANSLCKRYESQFENISKELAYIDARGAGDDSAIRETSRQLEKLNARVTQLMIFQVIVNADCTVPELYDVESRYTSQAALCALVQFGGDEDRIASHCDMSKW